MGNLGNNFSASMWQSIRDAWISGQGLTHRSIVFMKFAGYEISGNATNPDEEFRKAKYQSRSTHVYLSMVKAFDTTRGGYFFTGDLDCITEFRIQGFTAAYTLPDGTDISEYAGDLFAWNGKLWMIADTVEPVQFGFQAPQVWWRSVLRRTDRSGPGIGVGP